PDAVGVAALKAGGAVELGEVPAPSEREPPDGLLFGEGEQAVRLALLHERLEPPFGGGALDVIEPLALLEAPEHAPAAGARALVSEQLLELRPQLRGQRADLERHGSTDSMA